MKNIIICGNGSHAELVYVLFKEEDINVVAFTITESYIKGDNFFGLPIVPFKGIENVYPPSDYDMFIAIGPHRLNSLREDFYNQAKAKGYSCPAFVSKMARVPSDFKCAENCWVDNSSNAHPLVSLGGNNVIINSNLGHHTKIGNHCFISSAIIGGKVTIEDNVFVGIGSIIKQGITIGKGSVIGMGCIITEDVPPYSVYGEKGTKRRDIDSRRMKLF